MPLHLSVITPARLLVDAEVDQVVAPGREGEFGVLPGHELFLAPLRPGILRFRTAGQEQRLVLSGGFAEVTHDSVTVLAPAAFRPGEVDKVTAGYELTEAETALRELGSHVRPEVLGAAQDRVELARARLSIG